MQDYSSYAGILSIILVTISALIYYFGRLIGDTRVEEYDKEGYYIKGFSFFGGYLLTPFIIVLSIDAFLQNHPLLLSTFRSNIGSHHEILLVIDIIILSLISHNIKVNNYLIRLGMLEYSKNMFQQKWESFENKKLKKYELCCNVSWKNIFRTEPEEMFENVIYRIPTKIFGDNKLLIIISILTIYISYYYISKETSFIVTFLSLVLAFFIFTSLALSVGYKDAYYPPAKIQMKDGETLDGKIVKFGEYIYLLKDDKKYFINRDCIKHVEENLFK